MKKEKAVYFKIEEDLLIFLKEVAKKNRTTLSHEIRQLIHQKYRREKNAEM